MSIFLVAECAGLIYVTRYYTQITEQQAVETTQAAEEQQQEETTTVTVSNEPQTAEAEEVEKSGNKRDWDGEYGGVDEGNNLFVITWTADFADFCEVQRYDADSSSWNAVNIIYRSETEETQTVTAAGSGSVSSDGVYTYATPQLESCTEVRYRVIAEDATTYSVSATLICQTSECAIGATVWPVKDLTAYTTASGSTKAGTVTTLKAYLVTDEGSGRFGVEVNGDTWYIDSDYCMINLPDYVGDLCEYDIANSHDSIYMIHECEIPGVTGTVIAGYEDVCISGGTYLVPLLYPAAKKLVAAAASMSAEGYHFKIYDSYRPNEASSSIYSLTLSILDDPVPELDGSATYRQVMVGSSSYSISSFLAKSRSMHNLGIAMDLTIVDDSTGREVTMQTSMHDLSYHSAVSENTALANFLRDVMVDAGFGTLSSEWWHFQDNEARDSLNLPTLYEGVKALGE